MLLHSRLVALGSMMCTCFTIAPVAAFVFSSVSEVILLFVLSIAMKSTLPANTIPRTTLDVSDIVDRARLPPLIMCRYRRQY